MLVDGTLKSLRKQVELFERAAAYPGRTREKVVALGEAEELYCRLYPHHYRALQTMRVASQLGHLADVPHDAIYKCESRLISLLMNVVLEGLHQGELSLVDRQRPPELAFTLWSLAFGARALMSAGVATRHLGIDDSFRVARDATSLLMDALGWVPYSWSWDYAQTRARVREELFASEWREIRLEPAADAT